MNRTLIVAALMAIGLAACGDKPAPKPPAAPEKKAVEAPAPAPVAAPTADAAKDAPKADASAPAAAPTGDAAKDKMGDAKPKEGDPPFGTPTTSSTPADIAKAAVKGAQEGAKDGGGVTGAASGAKTGVVDAMKK